MTPTVTCEAVRGCTKARILCSVNNEKRSVGYDCAQDRDSTGFRPNVFIQLIMCTVMISI